jgi:acetylornithine deacetylase/succinyl-diaminopimelate desuccinylase-like protein
VINEQDEVTVKKISNKLISEDKVTLLMARWRYPSLSLHGISGAYSGAGSKTVVPAKVGGKFTIRLVPDQTPDKIHEVVKAHLQKQFVKVSFECFRHPLTALVPVSHNLFSLYLKTQLNSPNKMTLDFHGGGPCWLSDIDHPNYEAADKAIQKVCGIKPDYTREGGSIPIAGMLEDATQMNVMLLPVGACDDMAHSQNEKYNRTNLVNAIKVG